MSEPMNQMHRPQGTATYQDILDAPPNMTAEIIYGALHTQPRPGPDHAAANTALSALLWTPFQKGTGGPGGWRILVEPQVHFGTDVFAPDVAGWRHETMPVPPKTSYFEVVPDWVCEVHSPSTRKIDQIDKSEIYAAFGVKHMWFVDPEAHTLIAYENNGGAWTTIATLRDDDRVRVAPFDAAEFHLQDLWD